MIFSWRRKGISGEQKKKISPFVLIGIALGCLGGSWVSYELFLKR